MDKHRLAWAKFPLSRDAHLQLLLVIPWPAAPNHIEIAITPNALSLEKQSYAL